MQKLKATIELEQREDGTFDIRVDDGQYLHVETSDIQHFGGKLAVYRELCELVDTIFIEHVPQSVLEES